MTEKEEKSQHYQASTPCVFLIGLAVILVLSLPFIILNVRELFRAKEVKIGILEPSGSEKTFEKIAFTAVEIFNLNSRDGKLSVYSRHNSSESVPDVFRRLYGDGVRVFLLSEEVRTEEPPQPWKIFEEALLDPGVPEVHEGGCKGSLQEHLH